MTIISYDNFYFFVNIRSLKMLDNLREASPYLFMGAASYFLWAIYKLTMNMHDMVRRILIQLDPDLKQMIAEETRKEWDRIKVGKN